MRRLLLASCFGVAALFTAGYAVANDELMKMSADPNQWVMPGRQLRQHTVFRTQADQHRERPQARSSLDFLDRRPARTRRRAARHRRRDVCPYAVPEHVFALDLNNDGKILWKYEPKQDPNVIPVMCCDTVNRGLVAMPTARSSCIRRTRRSWPSTPRPAPSPGRSRTAIRRRAQPAPTLRSSSRTRCSSACRAASSAFADGSAPTTSRTASSRGGLIPKARIPTSSSIRRRPWRSASRSARIRA